MKQHGDRDRDRAEHGRGALGRRQQAGSACELYQHPAAGETVTAYESYNVTWDCSCLGSSVGEIDITLYLTGGGALHRWTHVQCASNTFRTTFIPSWWNGTTSESMQLQITQSDQPVWATTAAPSDAFSMVWNGTVPASATGSARNGTSTGVAIESVRAPDTSGGVTGGKLAAAVTIPLIAGALAVAAYIVYSRKKGKNQRKRWSAYVDNRMSHYSAAQDTSAASFADANTSRPSMTMSMHASRPSLSAASAIARPSSTFSTGGSNSNNFAGVGSSRHVPAASISAQSVRPSSSFYALDGHTSIDNPPLSSTSSGTTRRPPGVGQGADRVSRVSFAESSQHSPNKRMSYVGKNRTSLAAPNSFSPDSMPRVPALTYDVTAGLDDSTAHALSIEEVASIPSSSNTKKHNITVSMSMPAFAGPNGRQSIMSPDDLLRAYAIKGKQADDEEVVSEDGGDRKGMFSGKFGWSK